MKIQQKVEIFQPKTSSAMFCVTFCPLLVKNILETENVTSLVLVSLFFPLQLLAPQLHWPATGPSLVASLLVQIKPVSPQFKHNFSSGAEQSNICFLCFQREELGKQGDIRHQASGVLSSLVALKQLALPSIVQSGPRRKSLFVRLDFYRILFSAAFVGRRSGCARAECPF